MKDTQRFLKQLADSPVDITNSLALTSKVNNETRRGVYLKTRLGLTYTLWFVAWTRKVVSTSQRTPANKANRRNHETMCRLQMASRIVRG
jgi:hypothetical protein